MQSISKRELFIEAWEIYKENGAFMLHIGFIMFAIQVLIPNIIDEIISQYSIYYYLYQCAYMILSTGVSLGIIVQSLRIVRGGGTSKYIKYL